MGFINHLITGGPSMTKAKRYYLQHHSRTGSQLDAAWLALMNSVSWSQNEGEQTWWHGAYSLHMLTLLETGGHGIYPLVNIQKAIENGHWNSGFSMIFPLKMVIVHCYVSLPEGTVSFGQSVLFQGYSGAILWVQSRVAALPQRTSNFLSQNVE